MRLIQCESIFVPQTEHTCMWILNPLLAIVKAGSVFVQQLGRLQTSQFLNWEGLQNSVPKLFYSKVVLSLAIPVAWILRSMSLLLQVDWPRVILGLSHDEKPWTVPWTGQTIFQVRLLFYLSMIEVTSGT